MKRKNWTHDVRHRKHELNLEFMELPKRTSPAYSNRTAEEADRIHIEMQSLRWKLLSMKLSVCNEYWMQVNLRWVWIRVRLQSYQAKAAALRALERIKAAREATA